MAGAETARITRRRVGIGGALLWSAATHRRCAVGARSAAGRGASANSNALADPDREALRQKMNEFILAARR
jgi:hypothetical protein